MTQFDPRHHRRRSIRLTDYDYSQAGNYFVTILVRERQELLAKVVSSGIELSKTGEMVLAEWEALPTRFPGITIDTFMVMPDHIHGIITLLGRCKGEACLRPLTLDKTHEGQVRRSADARQCNVDHPDAQREGRANEVGEGKLCPYVSVSPHGTSSESVSRVVQAFKSLTTRKYVSIASEPVGKLWHRNYFERVIRDEAELTACREYILTNPQRWFERHHRSQ